MEIEQQLEGANRLKEDYNKQLKKSQQMMKEYQQDAEDARQAKEELAASLREADRKYDFIFFLKDYLEHEL